ncbi:hypothetical protein C0971_16765 [Bacillus methanolicus]|uniref:hypothetical protein n=1 Tax=Bacillus methanolicus TaxID=1471 RepID=UPI00200E4124|nr:hypothetical protein [Bacillus methanolicus]UQD53487.1 hypothetical protein C0971_16765 [Bacillus methanolicus]
MKKKKYIVGKTVLAATVATSVFAVANTADAASVSEAEKAVAKAEKLAGALKWEVSIEYRKTKYPNNLFGYPNMKLFNDTKKALAEAKKSVSALKGKEKEVLQARLDANVTTYVNRAAAYIDAVSSGLKIQKKYSELKSRFDKNIVDDQTEKLYHELSKEIKKNAFMLDRVYGATTRNEFRNYYKHSAENLMKQLVYPVSIKIEIDRAEEALKAKNIDLAAMHLSNVDFLVSEAAKKGQKESSAIIKSALSKLENTQKEFNKVGVLYIAKSTNSASPSTFGPVSGSETINKTVYIVAGKNQHLKLRNVTINGNLVVKGSLDGSGTVYLENVKVNKVNGTSGSIIVEDVADHSLYLKGVEADSVVVNDANGSNLVAQEGVKVKSLVVSEKAGAKGSVALESKAAGSFETITIAAKGSANSQGVVLKGNLSATSVNVTGENAKIAISEGATVKQIKLNAAASVAVAKGAVVEEIKKDPSVTGKVEVDNKGTIKKADEGIEVKGNKPEVVTPPAPNTPPSVPGGGGGGPSVVIPSLTSVNAIIGGVSVPAEDNTFNLAGKSDSDVLTEIQIGTNPSTNVKVKVTSLTARGSSNWISSPIELPGTKITTKDLFGDLDTGTPGISLGNLRAVFSTDPIKISGVLVGSGGVQSSEITITINLGASKEAITTFTNEFGTITKKGNNTIEVVINKNKLDTTIGEIEQKTKVDFSQILISFAESASPEVAKLLNQLINNQLGKALEDIKLGELAGRSFQANGFTVEFKK